MPQSGARGKARLLDAPQTGAIINHGAANAPRSRPAHWNQQPSNELHRQMTLLRYGFDAELLLEDASLAAEAAQFGLSRQQPLTDLAQSLENALRAPLDYPPLAQCTTPGDRIVLALDRHLAQSAELVAATVTHLAEAGVAPDGIAVLVAEPPHDDPLRLLGEPLRQAIRLLVHDAADRQSLAYLAADHSGEPVLIHRALHEADLIVPIGCLRRKGIGGGFGIHGPIYPTFSDAQTQSRFRVQAAKHPDGPQREKLDASADEAAWLLGIQTIIQTVPAGPDALCDIVGGSPQAVARRAAERYHQAWGQTTAQRFDLVIGTICGGPIHQTWENVGRSLEAALAIVEPGGALVLCSALAESPGPAVQALARSAPRHAAPRLGRDPAPDAATAMELSRALDQAEVYWIGPFDPELGRQLPLSIIAPDELPGVIRRHRRWAVLHNAPLADVSLDSSR